MFGICIWLKLNDKNYYNSFIKQLINNFKLKYHHAHITIKYNLGILESINFYYKNYNKYTDLLCPINRIYKSSKENFHSLQLDFTDSSKKNIYHVSVAYRTDRPFNHHELEYANKLLKPTLVYKDDYKLNIYNCNSINSNNWFKII
jgi:hypothetical protein